jgi:hypothetical protein
MIAKARKGLHLKEACLMSVLTATPSIIRPSSFLVS